MLAFCSNDYLGLARHPDLVEAACAGARITGSAPALRPWSAATARPTRRSSANWRRFIRLPRALYFYAGYATNIGIIPALVGEGDALFSDALNHACLIDGARLSRATVHRYAHADMDASTRRWRKVRRGASW